MDADFEQHYQAAERAYGLGEYREAHGLVTGLWDHLESASDAQDQAVVLGWRAVVALLQGHIQLHGLQQPEQAALAYQRVLDSEPEATLAALAQQGLELCGSQNSTSPDLLKDPFLTSAPDPAPTAQPDVITAMPWLPDNEGPWAQPTPDPIPTPEPPVTKEPERPTEEPPLNSIEPAAQQPAGQELLEQSWLRVQLTPAQASPTDSKEQMGLIERIKGAFARSAGR